MLNAGLKGEKLDPSITYHPCLPVVFIEEKCIPWAHCQATWLERNNFVLIHPPIHLSIVLYIPPPKMSILLIKMQADNQRSPIIIPSLPHYCWWFDHYKPWLPLWTWHRQERGMWATCKVVSCRPCVLIHFV
jgi:hypothetical protein